jgi:nitronate monooxygenase
MRTDLCARLDIAHPIIQAPMAGGWTTPALASAVSEAGGLGFLAGARLTARQLREQIAETRRRTARPFGVNFLVATPSASADADATAAEPEHTAAERVLLSVRGRLGLPDEPPAGAASFVSVTEGLEIALDAGVRVIGFAMGSAAPYVAQAHAAGALVMASVTTVAEAEASEGAGADVIVAQGAEAGGHRSTFDPPPLDQLPLVGTVALVPAVVDAVSLPVVAAGGIMDGRGVAAALALGAAAAQLGTRFLLASESGTPPGYRRQLERAVETDTVVTDVFSGRAARGIRNAFVRAFRDAGARPKPWPGQGAAAADIYRASFAGDGEWAPLFAGQGVRLAQREQPAGEIVRELVAEAERVARRLAG